jgi:hypothetical protein
MTSLEKDPTRQGGNRLGKAIDTAAFVVAVGGFLVLLRGLSQASVSQIFAGAIGLAIGLSGGAISAILRLVGRRSD